MSEQPSTVIQSRIHPNTIKATLLQGSPYIALGISTGVLGQLYLPVTSFSGYGLLACIITCVSLYKGFKEYITLKQHEKFPTIIAWNEEEVYITSQQLTLHTSWANIQECRFQDETIFLVIDDQEIIFNHFSIRTYELLNNSFTKYKG